MTKEILCTVKKSNVELFKFIFSSNTIFFYLFFRERAPSLRGPFVLTSVFKLTFNMEKMKDRSQLTNQCHYVRIL